MTVKQSWHDRGTAEIDHFGPGRHRNAVPGTDLRDAITANNHDLIRRYFARRPVNERSRGMTQRFVSRARRTARSMPW